MTETRRELDYRGGRTRTPFGPPLFALFLLSVISCADPGSTSAWGGAERVLVLPTSWSDAPPTLEVNELQDAFFDADDSLNAWLEENSSGIAHIDGDVLPWATAEGRWADVSDCEPDAIIQAGIDAADAFDIADYDADEDGLIDHLVVLHAGRTADDRISWRCMFGDSDLAEHTVALQSQGLGDIGEEVPIGLYAHEAGHAFFSLRDQYRDHIHGDYGVGIWDAMGLGQWGPNSDVQTADLWRHPTHLAAPHKARIGWQPVLTVASAVDDLRIDPIEDGGFLVKVPGSDGDYFLEVRSPRGFSAALPGHGLLVWRATGDRWLELVQADGRNDLRTGEDLGIRPLPPIDANFGDGSDPFPGTLGVTELQAGIELTNIRHDGDAILLSIRP
jgi:M6 family metalloprotease-like protein